MKKVYSQKASTEVFALAPEQLAVFKSAGYETPTAEEAIADAGAVKLTPPEGKRAYVAFDFKAATEYCKRKGIFAGDGAGNFDWQKPITREQVAAVLYRTLERAGLLEALPDKK